MTTKWIWKMRGLLSVHCRFYLFTSLIKYQSIHLVSNYMPLPLMKFTMSLKHCSFLVHILIISQSFVSSSFSWLVHVHFPSMCSYEKVVKQTSSSFHKYSKNISSHLFLYFHYESPSFRYPSFKLKYRVTTASYYCSVDYLMQHF